MADTRTAPEAKVSASRSVAFDLLRGVLAKRTPLDEALAAHDGLAKLPDRDRGFARLLVATTLRRLGHVDRLIDKCLDKPLPTKAAVVRDILRLAATELLVLGVAPHAAVDSAVTLVRSRGFEPFVKLTNAVLRRLDREGRGEIISMPALAALPDWLADGWRAAYGEATAEAMAAAGFVEPPLDISVKADPEGWAGKLGATVLPTGTLRRGFDGRVEALAGFSEGAWWVQDMAAALPARLFGPVAGRRIVDLCAAPGGKTAQLVAAGAQVLAVDRSKPRLQRLERNLGRLGLSAATRVADAAEMSLENPAEAILLDAPCSATGTIRRHPDVPWLKHPEDPAKLAVLQDRLIANAVRLLAPGGTLMFCTCSLEPVEGPERVAAALASIPGLRREPIRPEEVGGLAELISADGDLRSRPDQLANLGGIDGFYACRLVRT
ncbi:MFS transporter [Thalassobaculum fulvum]|uniref:MFS transporter n=1 Tax=Thalassobaculum fulvum TaxID=1633335 RepID=A0A919CQG2_9PROT|nr:RsmB/NOP family class I SAM-dependent RNA methyltransferase [Thalassobaculum fulvum]GHD55056.1 MFS transporter [Thalassobaculum fulvum]